MMSSIAQSARPLTMPQSSLTSRGRSGAVRNMTPRDMTTSGERKEHVLQADRSQSCFCTQLIERAHAADFAVGEEHEAIADALGVVELMDCQHERATAGRHAPNERRDLARLSQIEAVERLVHQQQRLRREQG